MRALPPLSLYVHIPWCARKCPYCDFNSHAVRGALPEQRYVAALLLELERAAAQTAGRRVETVFFGGGTPSLLSPRSIAAILEAARARLALAPQAEVTLEANPGSAEAEKFRGFREAGVNRLSIGVQSFDPRQLRALGRIHDEREARRAVERARHYFDNVNLDLMYGLPGQSLEQALADLETALAFDPPHLSCYQLTIEPNTYFHRFPPRLPHEDTVASIEQAIEARLAAAGYEHYEISAFARRGAPAPAASAARTGPAPHASEERGAARFPLYACAHNLNYWTFGDYLGIGAGAHAKLSGRGRIWREVRVKHPARYLQAAERGDPVQERREVSAEALPFEFMMNALRLAAGFPPRLFEERTGLPLARAQRALEQAERRGFIRCDSARIAPTALGQRFLNDVLQIFLPQPGAI
jgi:oxygen-independent coproporphyrinogen-3 oxidase